jgi:hypothetical protein
MQLVDDQHGVPPRVSAEIDTITLDDLVSIYPIYLLLLLVMFLDLKLYELCV